MQINTQTSQIIFDDGTVCGYHLEKERKWNIGLRRHVRELTGRIVLNDTDKLLEMTSGNQVKTRFDSWDHIRDYFVQRDWRGR